MDSGDHGVPTHKNTRPTSEEYSAVSTVRKVGLRKLKYVGFRAFRSPEGIPEGTLRFQRILSEYPKTP